MTRLVGSVVLLLLAGLFGYVIADHNCISMPTFCQNGALCHDNDNAVGTHWSSGPTCECNPPYAGSQCQLTIRDCHDYPCQNGGSCLPWGSASPAGDYFKCKCPSGFGGDRCEYPSPCASNPCRNGAVCNDSSISTTPGISCNCAPAYNISHIFLGVLCETAVFQYECNQTFSFAQPCQNGGTCIATNLSYPFPTSRCACPNVNVSGHWCESTFCATANCHNGTCFNGQCYCLPFYYGTNCERNFGVDFCSSSPCKNGGTCSTSGLGSCSCAVGYSGTNCEIFTPDFCTPNPCQNGGTCISDGNRGGFCFCTDSYVGTVCGFSKYSFCSSSPCQHGVCVNATTAAAGACSCVGTNYTGQFCQIPWVPTGCALPGSGCPSAQCHCQSRDNCALNNWNDNCDCLSLSPARGIFYGGAICNVSTPQQCNAYPTNLNYPCQHGGTCIDHRDGILCACLTGYYGDRCQYYNNPCYPNPCLNGGMCTAIFSQSTAMWNGLAPTSSYYTWTCTCKYPYYGANCGKYAYGPNICPSTTTVGFLLPTPYCPAASTQYGPVPCLAQAHGQFSSVVLYKGLQPAVVYDKIANCQCPNSTFFIGPNCDLSTTDYVNAENAKKGQVIPANCTAANCQNGATCVNDTNGVFQYCGCRPGTTGKYCQFAASSYSMRSNGYVDTPDYCSVNRPCQNGGTCINLVNGVGFTCLCPPGYSSSVTHSGVFTMVSSALPVSVPRTTEEYYCEKLVLLNGASSIVPSAIFTLLVALFAALFA